MYSAGGDGDMPRPTPGILGWAQECVELTTSLDVSPAAVGYQCARALHQSVWALEYLGASESCVIGEMTRQMQGFLDWGSPVYHSERGWFRCPTVIMPDADQLDYQPMLDGDMQWLVQRCLDVLPADVELTSTIEIDADGEARRIERPKEGATCAEWAWDKTAGPGPNYKTLKFVSGALVREWMRYHYGPPFGWGPG